MGPLSERAPFLAAKEGRMARDENKRRRDGEDISLIDQSPLRAHGHNRRRIAKFVDLGSSFNNLRLAKENMVIGQSTNHAQNVEDKSDRKSKSKKDRDNKSPRIPKMDHVLSKREGYI